MLPTSHSEWDTKPESYPGALFWMQLGTLKRNKTETRIYRLFLNL